MKKKEEIYLAHFLVTCSRRRWSPKKGVPRRLKGPAQKGALLWF